MKQDSVFVLNIGNTHTECAYWKNGSFGPVSILRSASVDDAMLPDDCPAAAACVVPEIREKLQGHGVFFLDAAAMKSVDFSGVAAEQLGADRAANAVAAAERFPLSALVLDFGTAITAEIVDEEKKFRGGAIMPGRLMMRRALKDYTAQLPLVNLLERVPEKAGTNTCDAISLGIDRGVIGLVKEWIDCFEKEFGTFKSVIAVGGDAKFFLDSIPRLTPGGTAFTLSGVLREYLNSAGGVK